jgi:hypothetical protein
VALKPYFIAKHMMTQIPAKIKYPELLDMPKSGIIQLSHKP